MSNSELTLKLLQPQRLLLLVDTKMLKLRKM